MKTIFKTFILFIVITTINSCSEDDNSIIINEDISISPDIGPKNTVVSITGIAFGTDITKVKVFFNDKEATVQSVTDTQIEAIVPVKAGTGLVKVVLDGAEDFGPEFTYTLTGEVSTLTGMSGEEGYIDGDVDIAKFSKPSITLDAEGNLWIADRNNLRIRKITGGVVSTISGSNIQGDDDGPIATAKFWSPSAITADKQGNIFIIDHSHKIRKITPNGMVSTLAGSSSSGSADGTGVDAQFKFPKGIATDTQGNVYVADFSNHKIRKITPNGVVSTLAGGTNGFADGEGNNAQFSYPRDVTVDTDDNVYVADYGNFRIRKITPNGEVSTIAGSNIQGYGEGTGSNARFNTPFGITVDAEKNVYVADLENYAVRKITPNGVVSTLAGGSSGINNGSGSEAQFLSPSSLAIDAEGNLYVGEIDANKIRKIIQE